MVTFFSFRFGAVGVVRGVVRVAGCALGEILKQITPIRH